MLIQLGHVENVARFQRFCGLFLINIFPAQHTTETKTYAYNKLVHSFFYFASELGNETFYITFLPFIFWNVDEFIGRRMIFLWLFNMYAGQGLKDILCWPRPSSPPVIRLEQIYESEYGMPSTHAIGGSIIPFSLLCFSYGRFQYELWHGLVIFLLWTTSVCLSRVYKGMHTFQDIFAGLAVASLITTLWLPYMDISLEMFLSKPNAWIFIIFIPILMIYVFPTKCMETRNDTTRIICSVCGAMLGSWHNYYIDQTPLPNPYNGAPLQMFSNGVIAWILFSASRFIIGLSIIVPVKITTKAFIMRFVVFLSSEGKKTFGRKANEVFTIPYLFITYTLVGYSGIYIAPKAFHSVGLIH